MKSNNATKVSITLASGQLEEISVRSKSILYLTLCVRDLQYENAKVVKL